MAAPVTQYSLPPGYSSIFITIGKVRSLTGGNKSVYATVSADGYAVEVYGAAPGPATLAYTDTNGPKTVIIRCELVPTAGYVPMAVTAASQSTYAAALSGGPALHSIISPDRIKIVAD